MTDGVTPVSKTPRLVLDASIALRWCFGDGADADAAKADSVLAAILDGTHVIVPPVWPLEVGNVIVRAE
ncbi:MAG: VapC toxin family PIN domain ribonuclease, partial [Burkholderiaceae bacterium]